MTERDRFARQVCRWLGGLLNAYVTGDPGVDDLAEYLAGGWPITDDYYNEDDQPRDTGGELVAALRHQADALSRLAREVEIGAVPLDALRRLDLPRLDLRPLP